VAGDLHSGGMVTAQVNGMTLTFRCPRGLENVLPKPIPAALGLPDWFKALPQRSFNPTLGGETFTVKKCPPFIDAMTYGFLIPLATDLEVRDGEFTWNFDLPKEVAGDHSYAPIDFHDPSQAAGTPFFDEDRFVIKFRNLWTIQAPEGYSLLVTHPVNRGDLPFTTLTGLVDCDSYYHNPLHFPARWSDPDFNGVLPKGTPVAQCLPVKREIWVSEFEVLSEEETAESMRTRDAILQGNDVYRRQFRAPKR
jgi:hypothetical protein